ncbi:MAG: hypothetical protein JSR55_00595 [Proteobacteria bacterium]|nr:hypothetical protein [Pseudomonadota bacterium]
MFKFLSQKETAATPDRLIPYGYSHEAKHFHDDIAWYEQERARIDGRGFGRRDVAPERRKLLNRKPTAERVTHFAPDEERKALARHPGSLLGGRDFSPPTSPPPCGEVDKIRSAAKNFSGGGIVLDGHPPTRKASLFDLPTRGR